MTLSFPEVKRLMKAHAGKDIYGDRARKEYLAAVKQCATTYQEAGVIEDMEEARIALGYTHINLLSESYGTRLA